MSRLFPLLFLLFPAHAVPGDGLPDRGRRIRVAISRGSPSLNLKTSARLYVQEVAGGRKYMLLENSSYEIRTCARGIAVAGQELSSPIRLLPGEGQERVRLGKHVYAGTIVINATRENTLDIVEHVPLEEYLYGVLPLEMSPGWPLEALKAQAVASRTYALRHISELRDYDVSSGVERQVYGGTSGINSRVREAVDSTRGEILTYKKKPLTAYFHACCGGHTASARSAWGENITKPLYGVKDPFCRTSSHYRWEYTIPSSTLLKFIQSRGSTDLKVKSLKVYKKDRSGRAVSLKAGTEKGSRTVDTAELRKYLGPNEFRSTFLTRISQVKGGFEVAGLGWGHGVGMCQDGARKMAEQGRPYRKILRHYYPGAAIVEYD